MIYTNQTKQALRLCFAAHKEQVDKSGLPYVFHPFHLAEQMTDEAATITALLHDVVEDTDYTLEDLRKMGFPQESLDAIALMTHDKSVPYLEYVTRLRENPVASVVKLADLRHNSDLTRLDQVTEADRKRALKYRMAIAILESGPCERSSKRERMCIPLDLDRLCYLSVFYSERQILDYSLDIEAASDVHIQFPASYAEQLRNVLPAADSLPEALAAYLVDHSPYDFDRFLRTHGIPYQSFRY